MKQWIEIEKGNEIIFRILQNQTWMEGCFHKNSIEIQRTKEHVRKLF